MEHVLEKIKKAVRLEDKTHEEECECFTCRNPKLIKTLKKILDNLNKEESDEQRIIITKSLLGAILSNVKLSLVNRLGILSLLESEILDVHRGQFIMQLLEKESNESKGTYVV